MGLYLDAFATFAISFDQHGTRLALSDNLEIWSHIEVGHFILSSVDCWMFLTCGLVSVRSGIVLMSRQSARTSESEAIHSIVVQIAPY